jgi:hypothetical protein
MTAAQTGLVVDESTLKETVDATGAKLTWTKATGTPGISSQMDTFTATGANTGGYSWSYFGEADRQNPTMIQITVKKTSL